MTLRCDYFIITKRGRLTVKARIVRISNSQGVRLPKPLIGDAGLSEEVDFSAPNGAIVISRASHLPSRSA